MWRLFVSFVVFGAIILMANSFFEGLAKMSLGSYQGLAVQQWLTVTDLQTKSGHTEMRFAETDAVLQAYGTVSPEVKKIRYQSNGDGSNYFWLFDATGRQIDAEVVHTERTGYTFLYYSR